MTTSHDSRDSRPDSLAECRGSRAVWRALARLPEADGDARARVLLEALAPAFAAEAIELVRPKPDALEVASGRSGGLCCFVDELPADLRASRGAFRVPHGQAGGSALVAPLRLHGEDVCLAWTHPEADHFDAEAEALLTALIPLLERLLHPAGAALRFGHAIRTPLNALYGMTELLLDSELGPEQRELAEALARNADALVHLLDQSAGQAPPPSTPSRAAHPLTVLVVEDNRDNQVVMRGFLESLGHEAVLCDSGAEGVARVEQGGVDAVLMDLRMPGMSGLDATRAIRAWEAANGREPVPIIACSAEPPRRRRDQALAAGCTDFLSKPTRREAVAAALERALPRTRVLCVDDDADSRRLMEHFLGREGYAVELAVDGESGLAYLAEREVDIVLMDVEMPGLGGVGAVRALRARGDARPVLAATGHTDPDVHAHLREAGFDGIVVKPVRRDRLVHAIEGALHPEPEPEASPAPAADSAEPAAVARIDADLAPLVPEFLADRRADVARLRTELAATRWEEVRRAGHSMKGTGSAYGFDRVSALGRELEDAAKTEDVSRSAAAIDALADYLQRVRIVYV